jgi:hypothetical protein
VGCKGKRNDGVLQKLKLLAVSMITCLRMKKKSWHVICYFSTARHYFEKYATHRYSICRLFDILVMLFISAAFIQIGQHIWNTIRVTKKVRRLRFFLLSGMVVHFLRKRDRCRSFQRLEAKSIPIISSRLHSITWNEVLM